MGGLERQCPCVSSHTRSLVLHVTPQRRVKSVAKINPFPIAKRPYTSAHEGNLIASEAALSNILERIRTILPASS
jgi:hypothetical protein